MIKTQEEAVRVIREYLDGYDEYPGLAPQDRVREALAVLESPVGQVGADGHGMSFEKVAHLEEAGELLRQTGDWPCPVNHPLAPRMIEWHRADRLQMPQPRKTAHDFARQILHGSEVHREWLLDAAERFEKGEPIHPPPNEPPTTRWRFNSNANGTERQLVLATDKQLLLKQDTDHLPWSYEMIFEAKDFAEAQQKMEWIEPPRTP